MPRIWTPSDVISIGDGSDLLLQMDNVAYVIRRPILTQWQFEMAGRPPPYSLHSSEIYETDLRYLTVHLGMQAFGIDRVPGLSLEPVDLERYSVVDLLRAVNKQLDQRSS